MQPSPQTQQVEQDIAKKLFSPKVIIPTVVVLVVFGVLYFLLSSQRGKQQETALEQSTSEQTSPPITPAPSTLITMEPQNDSGQEGLVVITPDNGKVKVSITLAYAPTDVSQPAHIHVGKCPDVGSVKYPLTNVLNGKSETTLDVSISDLRSQLPLAVNVHKSQEEAKTYVSCGDVI